MRIIGLIWRQKYSTSLSVAYTLYIKFTLFLMMLLYTVSAYWSFRLGNTYSCQMCPSACYLPIVCLCLWDFILILLLAPTQCICGWNEANDSAVKYLLLFISSAQAKSLDPIASFNFCLSYKVGDEDRSGFQEAISPPSCQFLLH